MDQNTYVSVGMTIVIIASIVAMAFYCLTLYRLLQKIPSENHRFPSWFVWMFLVPIVGIVFQWMMLPFGIPATLKKYFANNPEALLKARLLFKIGLAQVIIITVGALALPPIDRGFAFLGIALWIWYWVIAVKFKNRFLK